MSDLDKAIDAYEASRLRYQALAESNIYGLSSEERLEQSRAYHWADLEMRIAWRRLEAIKDSRSRVSNPQDR